MNSLWGSTLWRGGFAGKKCENPTEEKTLSKDKKADEIKKALFIYIFYMDQFSFSFLSFSFHKN